MILTDILPLLDHAGDNGHEPTRPRYTIRNAAYAMLPQPPIEYLIDRLITSGSVNVFFGEPGSKKTYSMISLAVCAAMGRDWLEFGIGTPVKVLIIDEESGERRLTSRLADTIRGELALDMCPGNLSYVSLAAFDMGKDEDVKEVSKLIMEVGAQIVIIDALADIMSGDENSKQDTQPVLNHLRKICEDTDCAIILIHHSNKTGGYRGTSAIKGSIDLMVKVESENDSKFVNFITEKNRDGEPLKWAAMAVWGEKTFSMSPADNQEKKVLMTKGQIHVLQFLASRDAATLKDICDAAQPLCSERTAENAVHTMAGMKPPLVQRFNPDEPTSKNNPAKFALTLSGVKKADEL